MAAYNVITIGDDLLRAKAMAVRRFDARLHRMLDDMRSEEHTSELQSH